MALVAYTGIKHGIAATGDAPARVVELGQGDAVEGVLDADTVKALQEQGVVGPLKDVQPLQDENAELRSQLEALRKQLAAAQSQNVPEKPPAKVPAKE